MTARLEELGWNERFADAFAGVAGAGRVPARVVLEHTHIYRIATGEQELLARVSGRLRHQAGGRPDYPAVGDWVAAEPVESGEARIHAILPRVSRFSRRAAGDVTEEQILAANVDVVFLVGGLDGDFNPRRIERYLVVAWESGATPVIVLNKADLVEDPEHYVREVEASASGVTVHAVSAERPETLAVLRAHLGRGRTGALLGMSGVGKSTIVNRLVGFDLMRTHDVRIHDSRGRHTSTARQLVVMPDGVLIDTPGLRELQLWETGDSLEGAFADIAELANGCRFRDCSHRHEPGCAVRAAVDSGELPRGRFDSYVKLAGEREHYERQVDERALLEHKRRWKTLTKAANKHIKGKRFT